MRSRILVIVLIMVAAVFLLAAGSAGQADAGGPGSYLQFERVGTFHVFRNSDIDTQTVAEIVAATKDGRTLVYTDAATGSVGFVDIRRPDDPRPLGTIQLDGEPTSVDIWAQFAYVATNTSPDYVNTSGKLYVIHIPTQSVRAEYELGGQPDSVKLNRNGRYAVIVIENERDEDLGNGRPPQLPGGELKIFDTRRRTFRTVDLTGIATLFPEDPEPEFVDINSNDIAAVTMQENNHIVLVNVRNGQVIGDFSAGTVDLEQIDTIENDLIQLDSSLTGVPREPDAVTWISNHLMVTADEGDLDGGSRGFTIFNTQGQVVYSSGNTVEHVAASYGHYPEDRSENKGTEPEGVEFGDYRKGDFLFVGTERASLVLVYRLGRQHGVAPQFVQALAGGIGPEGLVAIPHRDLLVTAAEEDDPGGFRSVITIYRLERGAADYPTIISTESDAGVPITWGALSGLAADGSSAEMMYAVRDSFYQSSSYYDIDVTAEVPTIVDETFLKDTTGLLAAVAPGQVNADLTVNLDLEGIATRVDGGFWVASEGAGTATTRNLLLRISNAGDILEVVQLPASVDNRQRSNGYEGVAAVGSAGAEYVFVAFQREWDGDPAGHVRIGRYETATGEWAFYYYPLEAAVPGTWNGLSEITAVDANTFAVVERDNQADVYATLKHLYIFSVSGLTPLPDSETGNFPVVSKTLVYDFIPDLLASGGVVLDKVEGFAILSDGTAYAVTDNDGVDGSSGETQLLRIEDLLE